MRDPVCKYPKKPTGPSGFGESGVRRLQEFGGDYQRSRPASNTLSIQSGDFSKVIVEGVPEYVTSADGSGTLVVRDTMDHRRPFARSLASKDIPGTLAVGPNGLYVSQKESDFDIAALEYEYEITPGNTQPAFFDRERFTLGIYYGGYRANGRSVATYDVYYMYLPLTPGNTMFFKVRDEISYWGKHSTEGVTTISASIARLGRTEPVTGRPLADLTLIKHRRLSEGGVLVEFPFVASEFTRETAEFMWLTKQIVLKDYTVVLFAETFFRPGPVVVGEDYVPKFWAMATPNTADFGLAQNFNDLTAGVFSGARQPSATGAYSVTAGRAYQFDLSATMAGMEVAAVANDAFVVSWPQRMPTGWRARVARMVVTGGVVAATMAFESADAPSRTDMEFWQSIVHLGEGVVLAKIASGFPGIGRSVSFKLSTNGGMSWGGAFTPTGFNAPLLNQYFGDFQVHKPIKDGAPGRVLINSWDAGKSTYYVFSSDDNGATWERRAKIHKPQSFLRIDSMDAGDGGGNFESLLPGPVTEDEIDVTLPDRYKERP